MGAEMRRSVWVGCYVLRCGGEVRAGSVSGMLYSRVGWMGRLMRGEVGWVGGMLYAEVGRGGWEG